MSDLVIGGEGFIGSHLCDSLRLLGHDVTTLDLKSGLDARDDATLYRLLRNIDTVYHLAAHADIAQSANDPLIDFHNGTITTVRILDAMRVIGIKRIIYASSSAVYGDCGNTLTDENYGPLVPASTYAASKLACEAQIAAYCNLFGMTGLSFRFANVVGPRQPRGVGFDFMKKLKADPTTLTILGDGRQSKSYVHVSDVIGGMLLANDLDDSTYNVYNISTDDHLTADEIAEIAANTLNLNPAITHTGGRRGWNGDVPVVNIDSTKLRSLGWEPSRTSREAISDALKSML